MLKIIRGRDIKEIEDEYNKFENTLGVVIKRTQQTEIYDSMIGPRLTISVYYITTEEYKNENHYI